MSRFKIMIPKRSEERKENIEPGKGNPKGRRDSASARVQSDRLRLSPFLRTLGESLRWKDDRIAMALFAHIAAPQIRLTKDPNTYYFFLDHLALESPFRLADDTTWDTNIELGIYWGARLIDKDQELHGKSANIRL